MITFNVHYYAILTFKILLDTQTFFTPMNLFLEIMNTSASSFVNSTIIRCVFFYVSSLRVIFYEGH
jgi:hypothetical protein